MYLGPIENNHGVDVGSSQLALVHHNLRGGLPAEVVLLDNCRILPANPTHHRTGADHHPILREPNADPPGRVGSRQHDARDVALALRVLRRANKKSLKERWGRQFLTEKSRLGTQNTALSRRKNEKNSGAKFQLLIDIF